MKFYDLGAIRAGTSSIVRTLRDNPILAAFIALALVTRLTFWFYTEIGRSHV